MTSKIKSRYAGFKNKLLLAVVMLVFLIMPTANAKAAQADNVVINDQWDLLTSRQEADLENRFTRLPKGWNYVFATEELDTYDENDQLLKIYKQYYKVDTPGIVIAVSYSGPGGNDRITFREFGPRKMRAGSDKLEDIYRKTAKSLSNRDYYHTAINAFSVVGNTYQKMAGPGWIIQRIALIIILIAIIAFIVILLLKFLRTIHIPELAIKPAVKNIRKPVKIFHRKDRTVLNNDYYPSSDSENGLLPLILSIIGFVFTVLPSIIISTVSCKYLYALHVARLKEESALSNVDDCRFINDFSISDLFRASEPTQQLWVLMGFSFIICSIIAFLLAVPAYKNDKRNDRLSIACWLSAITIILFVFAMVTLLYTRNPTGAVIVAIAALAYFVITLVTK